VLFSFHVRVGLKRCASRAFSALIEGLENTKKTATDMELKIQQAQKQEIELNIVS
jgi:hypothetical protein